MSFPVTFLRNFRTDYETRSDHILLKRILSLLMVIVMVLSLVAVAAAVEAEENQSAQVTDVAVEPAPEQEAETETEAEREETAEEQTSPVISFYVNEQPVYDAPLYWLNDVPYVPVRPFFHAALPGCEILWQDGQAVIAGENAAGEKLAVSARPGDQWVEANGRALYVEGGVQLVDSTTMIPAAVLAKLFRGTVSTDETGLIHMTLSEALLAGEEVFYDAPSVDLLARLIFAESGNQPMRGKIAVGNVVLNRMASPLFPDSLYNVIYQSNQFSVVNNGAINKTPSAEAVIAAKLCLEGAKVTDALFFNVCGLRCWAALYRPYVTTIGNHDFYA